MHKQQISLIGLALFLFINQAQSFSRNYDYIEKIQVGTDGYIYVNVKENFNEDNNCRIKTFVKSQYTVSSAVGKAWLQLLISSHLAQKPIYLVTNGCLNNYPRLISVQLRQRKGNNPSPVTRTRTPPPTNNGIQCPNSRPTCCSPTGNNRCASLSQCVGRRETCR